MFVDPNRTLLALQRLRNYFWVILWEVRDVRSSTDRRLVTVHYKYDWRFPWLRVELSRRLGLLWHLFCTIVYVDQILLRRNIVSQFWGGVWCRLDPIWVIWLAHKATSCTISCDPWEKVDITILKLFLIFNGYIRIHSFFRKSLWVRVWHWRKYVILR